MYKCCECGMVFFEPEIVSQKHPYGMTYAEEKIAVCPSCNGFFDKAYPCDGCGEYFFKSELHNYYCIECLEDNWNKIDNLFDFAEDITAEGSINEFALDMFGGINNINDVLKILLKNIFNRKPELLQDKMHKFIEEYADDLAEILEEQNNE